MTAMKYCLSAAAGALALSLTALTAQAAPAGGSTTDLNATAGATSSVEKAAYRRCWWRYGRQYCRWVESDYDSYPYYYYGPSVGFSFGGGRGHHHHHHHH